MDKESICVLDIYFEHYDNFKYNKEMYNEFGRKFFEEQYRKCVDRYENKIIYYKNIAHIYKIELGRCVRKLTRIYKLFDKYIFTVFKHYPIGSAEFNFYIKCIEDMRKEIKNV